MWRNLIAGLFIIACFIALSVGTSMGTIVALVPIAVGISDKTGVAVALAAGLILWFGVMKEQKLKRPVGIIMLVAYAAYFVYLLMG